MKERTGTIARDREAARPRRRAGGGSLRPWAAALVLIAVAALAAWIGWRQLRPATRSPQQPQPTAVGPDQTTAESPERAIARHQQARERWRTLGDAEQEAETLKQLAECWGQLGDRARQLEFYAQAIALFRDLGQLRQVAELLNETGHAYRAFGAPEQALTAYDEALATALAIGDREKEADARNNLGLAHKNLGHTDEALRFYGQARELYEELGEPVYEAITGNNIGALYLVLGKPREALDELETAWELLRPTAELREQAMVLTRIGLAYGMLDEHATAVDSFRQALALRQQTGDRRGEATTLDSLAASYLETADMQAALDCYQQALAIWEELDFPIGIAKTTSHLGWGYLRWDRPEPALEYLRRALPMLAELHDRDGQAHALMGIARALRLRGDLDPARARLEEALALIESLRSASHSHGLRSSFLALRHDYYELYIDLLIELHQSDPQAGFDAVALEVSERTRARSLLELLAESGAEIRRSMPAELIARDQELRQQMAAKDQERRRLGATAAAIAAVEKEQRELAARFEQLQAEIRRRNPHYAALTQPQPLSAPQIQRLLDDQTLLLVYFLGEQRSFLWRVSADAIRCHPLPPRTAIEEKARQTHDWLRTSHKRFQLFRKRRAPGELSAMVLGPVATRLGGKRLLIVSDGMLEYVPFASLPAPRPPGSGGDPASRPLITEHEIVRLPSASVLALLRQRSASRSPAPKQVAVVADPVFSADDPRLAANPAPAVSARELAAELSRAAELWGLDRFERLFYSRREAEAILELADRGGSLKALDFDANRETVTSDQLASYRIVHFATHGMLHEEHPELSGLVLSLVDESGQPRDGLLYMHQIYGLELPAELVVLSACRTALGEQVRGEGMVGLTRGFMYAGAVRVVVSLWNVNDEATAELMHRFYQGMLGAGLTPAAALRQAQLGMMEHENSRWRAPYYWAGFILQGRWQ